MTIISKGQYLLNRMKSFYNRIFEEIDAYRTEEIKAGAYYLWEQGGKPEGRDLDFWLVAEERWEQDKSHRQYYRNRYWEAG